MGVVSMRIENVAGSVASDELARSTQLPVSEAVICSVSVEVVVHVRAGVADSTRSSVMPGLNASSVTGSPFVLETVMVMRSPCLASAVQYRGVSPRGEYVVPCMVAPRTMPGA